MENIIDRYLWERHRKILTPTESGIPALQTFGINASNKVDHPLTPHYHKDCMELVFLLKGFQIYQVGEEQFPLSGSDIFVSYPNEAHSSGGHPQSNCKIIWMQINLSPDLPFFGLDHEHAAALREELMGLPRVFSGESGVFSALLESFSALSEPDISVRRLGEQTVCWCLHKLIQLGKKTAVREYRCIERALEYILQNISEPIALEEIAAHCGLSLSRFKVRFKEETGTSPRDYVNHCKVQKAKDLLRAGETITETALSMGFSTPNYFATIFKKYTGISPTDFRQSKAETEADK